MNTSHPPYSYYGVERPDERKSESHIREAERRPSAAEGWAQCGTSGANPAKFGIFKGDRILWILAILLAPVLLIRFRKRWAAAIDLAARTKSRVDSSICRTITGLRHPYASRSEVRQGLPETSAHFSAPEEFLIGLNYGRESEWVKKVLADASLRRAA